MHSSAKCHANGNMQMETFFKSTWFVTPLKCSSFNAVKLYSLNWKEKKKCIFFLQLMKKSLCHFQLKLSVSIKYHGFSECSACVCLWNWQCGIWLIWGGNSRNEWMKAHWNQNWKMRIKNYAISCGTKGTFSLSHFESKYI